ncbi:MAG: DeoR/GlpR transcriptional regulator [Clostridia bacterium]|nr:DeoR/GlpR transcriptional regulator [Clostridia bacterium]
MLAIERRNAIISRLNMDGKVIVTDLAQEFGVTEETIRRDLEKLDNEGLAKKTYGGAVANKSLNIDLPSSVRKRANVELKQRIAEKIALMINDGDYVMADASSTAMYVIKCIKHKKNITLITNSVEILYELSDHNDWNILSTGGTLKPGALSLVGSTAEKMIRDFHVDIAICSCKGVDINAGITDSNEKDSQMKQAIFSAASRKVLAIDSTKFDRIAFTKVCDLGDVDVIVTDSRPSDKWIEYLDDCKTELVY